MSAREPIYEWTVMALLTKTVFLSKDSLLDVNHSCRLRGGRFECLADTIEGLRLLHLAGYTLIVITPEDETARGRFTQEAISHEEITLQVSLGASGIPVAGFYHCPHHPQGALAAFAHECRCRKPKPGLLIQAASEFKIDLQLSWLIGDILDDMEAGRTAGCSTIFLTNGNETHWNMTERRWPNFIAADLLDAASLVLLTDVDQLANQSLGAEDEEEAF
jgi:D,D-heptose 1,7-bisphosphate phosphatase